MTVLRGKPFYSYLSVAMWAAFGNGRLLFAYKLLNKVLETLFQRFVKVKTVKHKFKCFDIFEIYLVMFLIAREETSAVVQQFTELFFLSRQMSFFLSSSFVCPYSISSISFNW